jgi:hypothetical protein
MQPQKKSFDSPDDQFEAGKSKVAMVLVGGVTHKRITFPVGWRWSEDVMLSEEEKLCSLMHVFVHISGKFGIKMSDGTQLEFESGDVSFIPPGHDAWTIGEEPAVVIDHTPPPDKADK